MGQYFEGTYMFFMRILKHININGTAQLLSYWRLELRRKPDGPDANATPVQTIRACSAEVVTAVGERPAQRGLFRGVLGVDPGDSGDAGLVPDPH